MPSNHSIEDCQNCHEPYCTNCSDAPLDREYCSMECQEEAESKAPDTREDDAYEKARDEGLFDKPESASS